MQQFEEIAALLHIHREASQHGAMLKNITDAALMRLVQINAEMSREAFLDKTATEPEPLPAPTFAGQPVTPQPEPPPSSEPESVELPPAPVVEETSTEPAPVASIRRDLPVPEAEEHDDVA